MDIKEWLSQLISFDTTSRNSNLELIAEIESWCRNHGLITHVLPNQAGQKANLFATLPSAAGLTNGGLMLTGHTDVVPVDGQLWDTNPFQALEKEGKIFGRGTSDMKGFLAVILALMPNFKQLNLKKPIHFSFTYDEEIGCLGAPLILNWLKKNALIPEACIVGEPSGMKPVIGYKTRHVFHCQIKGLAAHSSLANQGCNAIEYASQLITYIRQIAVYLKEQGPFDPDFDVPYTTVTVNLISGGHAANIIPANCEFMLEIRQIPQFSLENFRSQIENYIADNLLPEMKQSYPDAEIFFDLTSSAPGFNIHVDNPITHLLQTITGVKERIKVSYSTEAGIFQNGGIPSIICGPGSIEQAHRANEYITLEQLQICEHVLKNVVQFFCL